MKTIELGYGYRLVRRDSMNWELQNYRAPAPNKGARRAASDEPRWVGCGKFYQSLSGAVRAVYEMALRDGEGATDLAGALAEAERIAAGLAAAVANAPLGSAR